MFPGEHVSRTDVVQAVDAYVPLPHEHRHDWIRKNCEELYAHSVSMSMAAFM
jgi:hypothetical protein